MEANIKITRTANSRLQTFDFNKIDYGLVATDHMFKVVFKEGLWRNPVIVPFQDVNLNPMALCLHYGQTVFEGMKAFRLADGNINIFRIRKHHSRMNKSLSRMCMPEIPESLFIEALKSLVELDQDWVSDIAGTALYLRPFVIATEARLGLKVSNDYCFLLVCTPSGSYYEGNIKVKVETEFVRAVAGGAGFAKNGGNYGAALLPTQLARKQGFDQVLWTDGKENKYIEESGTMNVIFLIDNIMVTPALSGTILDGVTRDSIITLAKDANIKVEERNISYTELEEAFKSGKKVEAFGTGTAVSMAPIEMIQICGNIYYPDVSQSATFFELSKRLNEIRTGVAEDKFGWNFIVQADKTLAISANKT